MENKNRYFTVSRTFKAPRELVFNAFSGPESLGQWWGPVGMPITVISLDFKPKGKFHYKSEGNGQVMYGIFVYHNIHRSDLIEFVSSFSDVKGNVCPAPFPGWPLEIFNELTLEEHHGETTLTLRGHPVNATQEEEEAFFSNAAGMNKGFSGTFDQLEEFLKRIQNQRS